MATFKKMIASDVCMLARKSKYVCFDVGNVILSPIFENM